MNSMDRFDITGAPCQSGVDPEIFFPDSTDLETTKQAKKLCKTCSRLDECLTFAIKTKSVGVWGGMTLEERKLYVRKQTRRSRAIKPKESAIN